MSAYKVKTMVRIGVDLYLRHSLPGRKSDDDK